MKKRFHILLLTLAFLGAGAQLPVMKNFNTSNGLPSNEVYFLHSDKKGYIWMCTDGGLVKYNGNFFKIFSSANGMPDNTIFEVKEDYFGRTWYRSFSGKIGYIQNDSVFCPPANKAIERFIKDGIVSSFAFDKKGNVFVGKRNSEKISFLKLSPPYNENNVTEIWVDNENSRGIDIIKIENDCVFSDVRGAPVRPYAITIYDGSHKTLYKDSSEVKEISLFTTVLLNKNYMYLGTNSLLRRISLRDFTTTYKHYPTTIICLMAVDSLVLVGKQQNGISSVNSATSSSFGDLPDKLTFTRAVKDLQGGMWFSTLEAGVFYLPFHKTLYTSVTDNPGEQVSCLFKQNDSTIIAGFNTGKLIMCRLGQDTKVTLTKLYSDTKKQLGFINTIHPVSPNQLIVSGSLGSLIFNPATKRTATAFTINGFGRPAKYILNYKDSLLTLHLKEIRVFPKPEDFESANSFTSEDRLTAIEYDHANDLVFVGGLRGLYRFYHQKQITEKDRILTCRIQDIKACDGVLYIATNSEGLIIKRGNRYDTINESKGLISNICKAVTVSEDHIWISTNKGISQVTVDNNDGFKIKNYPLSEFIEAASNSRITIIKDRAYFFSGGKIYSFPSEQKPVNSVFRIASLSIQDKFIPVKKFTRLDYRPYNIRITYEALFYDCNKIISYRYKLNPNSTEWNYTNENTIVFPRPAAGDYEFIIEAKNNNGDWIRAKENISFSIDKPFWTRWWFILLITLVLSTIIGLILWCRYLNILKREREKNATQVAMYELETRVVKAQMNPHFIFNSLNSIQQFILGNENENAYRYLSKFSKLVRKLLESNTKESITVDEEAEILNRYVEIESLRFEDSFSYSIFVDEKLRSKNIKIPHMLIQPFVENAIWHGLMHKHNNKRLDISFTYSNPESLVCTVEDNGVGRNLKKPSVTGGKRSLAIELIRQRMQLLQKIKKINCGFEITDKTDPQGLPEGTLVTITIPIIQENENIKSRNY